MTGEDPLTKGDDQETCIDALVRFLPLPATQDEKVAEIQGNRENAGSRKVAVADKCRYRYPSATTRKKKMASFQGKFTRKEAGSGVADKMAPSDELHRLENNAGEFCRYLKRLHVKSLRSKELQATGIQIVVVYTY